MRKHVLLLVHGMGDNVNDDGTPQTDWADNARRTLEDEYKKYAVLNAVPFEERFEVVPVSYDSVFNNLLTRWADRSRELRAVGVPIDGVVGDVFDWLDKGAKQEDNFAWTHMADVIFYRFFSPVRQRVKTCVAKQFKAALKPTTEGSVSSWSVIAHSLGCVVTHDVLHAMDTTTPNEDGISILDAMVPAASIVAMIANVSKLLENDMDVYDSQVVPPTAIKPNTACFHYLSANNKLDPFLLSGRFEPRSHPEWREAKKNKTFLDIRIGNVHEVNVHGFKNYMVNPAVHIPLFERIVGRGAISQAEKEAARTSFEDIAVDGLLNDVKELLKDSRAQSWFKVVGLFYGLLKRFQEN